ncbi:hypothetical protein D3C86_1264870 [compost metagenome]
MILSTGLMVPKLFEIWVTATSFVFGESMFWYSSRTSSPLLLIGMTFKVSFFRSASICHGTILEWCSIAEIMISSPALSNSPNELATRLIPSVVPLVKMISSFLPALIKRRTISRASSYSLVAFWLKWCTPR